jgi:hypothetical protein
MLANIGQACWHRMERKNNWSPAIEPTADVIIPPLNPNYPIITGKTGNCKTFC